MALSPTALPLVLLVALALSSAALPGGSAAPYTPRILSGTLTWGSGWLYYRVVVEPFLGNKTVMVVLYSYNTSRPGTLFIKSASPQGSTVGLQPLTVTRPLNPARGTGFAALNATLKTPPHGGLAKLGLELGVASRGRGVLASRTVNLTLGIYPASAGAPTPVALGAAASLSAVILGPIAIYLRATGRRRASLAAVAIAAALAVAAAIPWARSTRGGSGGLEALRYEWASSSGGGSLYLVREGEDSWVAYNLSYTPRGVSLRDSSPALLYDPSLGGRGCNSSYYYMGALRSAVELEAHGLLALYGCRGHLLYLVDRAANRTIYLVSSVGYGLPLRTSYYAKLFVAPPVATTGLAYLLVRLARGGRGVGVGHKG